MKVRMQDRRDPGKEGSRKGGIQERLDSGKFGFRTRGRQETRDSGNEGDRKEEFRKAGSYELRNAGKE